MAATNQKTVLVILMGTFFSLMGARLILSPLVPNILETYSINKGTLGLALTGMWAAYGLLQFPGGIIADRVGEQKVVLLGTVLAGCGITLVGISPSFVLFAVAVVLIGAGGGLYFPAAGALLTRIFDNTGQALSVHIAGGNAAGLILPVVAGYLTLRYNWRIAIFVSAGLILVMLAISLVGLQETPAQRPNLRLLEEIKLRRVTDLLTQPSIAFTTIIAILLTFTFQSILSFFPTFLIEFYNFSTTEASTIFSSIFVVIVIFLPIVGWLSDVTTPDTAIAICSIAIMIGITIALLQNGWITAMIGAFFIGLGTTWGGVVGARFMLHFSAAERGTGYGLVRSVYVVIGSSGNTIMGIVADSTGWVSAFGILVFLLLGVIILLSINHVSGAQL
jgi:MFS family permease